MCSISQFITDMFTLLTQKLQLSYWTDVVEEFFTSSALLKLTLWKDKQREEVKAFGPSLI
jgi:LIM-domain binding protein